MTCLAKKPIVRDPNIFDRKEAARGSRARQVTCRIQKWNIKAEGFHPILVANARVDWLAMDDDDITKKFPILLEGILQDVYSQRAASAWQGAQPQKLTVSMLLPGTSSAAEWRDLLQSRPQFWPTLTVKIVFAKKSGISGCGCHLWMPALVCMTAFHLLVVIGLFACGEVLSALGTFHLHVSPRCWRRFCVWCWVLVFVVGWCFPALVLRVLLCFFPR